MNLLPSSKLERLREKYVLVNPESGCWEWQGTRRGKPPHKYGCFRDERGGRPAAHRVFYEAYKGAIPEGYELDHLCRVTYCVNPQHLEAVTHRENILRGISPSAICATLTTCPKGHRYDKIRVRSGGKQRRICTICAKERSRIGALAYYYRNKDSYNEKRRLRRRLKKENQACVK